MCLEDQTAGGVGIDSSEFFDFSLGSAPILRRIFAPDLTDHETVMNSVTQTGRGTCSKYRTGHHSFKQDTFMRGSS